MSDQLKLYGPIHLRQKLIKANLPYNTITIRKYERLGIISKPQFMVSYGERARRNYTGQEIKEIVAQIKAHVKDEKRKQKESKKAKKTKDLHI